MSRLSSRRTIIEGIAGEAIFIGILYRFVVIISQASLQLRDTDEYGQHSTQSKGN